MQVWLPALSGARRMPDNDPANWRDFVIDTIDWTGRKMTGLVQTANWRRHTVSWKYLREDWTCAQCGGPVSAMRRLDGSPTTWYRALCSPACEHAAEVRFAMR